MRLYLRDIVKDTYTNAAGFTLYVQLKEAIDSANVVELSFKDSSITSSSFLNSSFGAIIDEIGLNNFKSAVKPKELTTSQANMLKKYIASFEIVN